VLVGREAERRVLDGLVAGAEAERDLPFGGLGLVLAPAVADLERLPAPQAAALRTALALDAGPPTDRFAVGAATLGVLTRQAEQRPLALLLDDAHHLDRPSAEALVFAARRLVADPIVLVAALRDGEANPLRGAGLPELALAGLDEAGTADLLRSADVTPNGQNRASWVHRATGGNPLAIVELARGSGENAWDTARFGAPSLEPVPVPAVLAESFVRRAEAVSPSAITVLALVEASAGDVRVVLGGAAAFGLDPGLLARAEAAALVRTTADRVEFTHPLVGSSAYASLTSDRRREVHAAVVAALPPHDAVRRAWHGAAAALGPDAAVADALEEVVADARRRGAYAVAASAGERAAQLTVDEGLRADRGVAAAGAAFDAGDAGWALRLLDTALVAQVSAPTRSRAEALRGAITSRSGALGEAWATLVAAAREVADSDPDRALHLVAEAVDVAFYLADADVARQSRRLAETLLHRGVTDRAAGIGRLAIGMAQVLDGQDGSAQLREGVRLLGGRTPGRPTVSTRAGSCSGRCSCATRARRAGCCAPSRRLARRRPSVPSRTCSSTWRGTRRPRTAGRPPSPTTARPPRWPRSSARPPRRRCPWRDWPGWRPGGAIRTTADSTRRGRWPSPSRGRS
jgi:hypothetical protein